MKPEFVEKNPPIDPKALDLFESTTGYKLPDDYKQFLLQHNGGNFYSSKIQKEGFFFGYKIVFDDGEDCYMAVNWFYSLESNGDYFFLEEDPYDQETYGNYGVQLVIATGDPRLVSICLEGENYGKIFALQENALYESPEKNFTKIADSFTEFMNGFDYHPIE